MATNKYKKSTAAPRENPLNLVTIIINMSVAQDFQQATDKFYGQAPPEVEGPINRSRSEINATFDWTKVPKPGETLPNSALIGANGKSVTRDELLGGNALLIIFYRDNWCPFCNIALRGLQKHVADFSAKDVRLVAVSAKIRDQSLSTKEKNKLEFEVLSDLGNKYAETLGIVWRMPKYLKELLVGFRNRSQREA